jgi:hypothetical protein
MAESGVMAITDVRDGIRWQADHAAKAFAPRTARVIFATLAVLDTDTALGRRMSSWHGKVLEDAMPLRIAGGLHWLVLSGTDTRLAAVYSGAMTDQTEIDALVVQLAETYDTLLTPWLDSPPQTNEAGRSSSVVAALLWLAQRLGPKFELNEIGASAGVNTMIERYRYDLGGVTVGRAESPMRLAPEWRGPPPPADPIEIISIRGADLAPVDLADPAQALRLKAFVWPDATERMARIDAAIALAAETPPDLVAMGAGEFVRERLAAPHASGVTRVFYHSVVWQYLPEATRSSITTMIEQAGEAATAEKPIAWVRLETNRQTFRHELTVRYWPGGGEPAMLGEAHPHGAWIEWLG